MPTRGARRKAAKQRQSNLARQYDPENEFSDDADVMDMEESINQARNTRNKNKGLTRLIPFKNPCMNVF